MAVEMRKELADALDRALAASDRGIVRSADLRRGDRERLVGNGYLGEVFKGWYFLTKPTDSAGETTAWYATFWGFLTVYLRELYQDAYCLSAVSSLDVHLGRTTVPEQVIAMVAKGGNRHQALPCDTSVLIYKTPQAELTQAVEVDGLRVMPLPLALVRLPATYFVQRPVDAEIAFCSLRGTADLCRALMAKSGRAAAGRIMGAYQFLGQTRRADEISDVLRAAGISVDAESPFRTQQPVLSGEEPVSPYAARISATFRGMRGDVLSVFGDEHSATIPDADAYLTRVNDIYQYDAYNSLSIEGYRVTPQLIQRIRDGSWDPDHNPDDQREVGAFAAKGYLEAFKLVRSCIGRVLAGEDVVDLLSAEYPKWYQALFSATVAAGILEPYHLAGFRNGPVLIKGSRHVPPPAHAVTDSMDALLAVLRQEESTAVRAVLGHFLFGFIHPYMDGNGRMARFFMNMLLAAGGCPWTIIRVSRRSGYMSALERASCEGEIRPFAELVLEEMNVDWTEEANQLRPT